MQSAREPQVAGTVATSDWAPSGAPRPKVSNATRSLVGPWVADDYLSKPFSFVVLVARLRALLRRGASPRPVVLGVGNLRLDPAAHRCWCAGQEVELTAKQFALLE